MRNACLAGIPCGAIVPYRLMGDNRPECDMNELIDLTGRPIFCHPERRDIMTEEEVEEYFAAKAGE